MTTGAAPGTGADAIRGMLKELVGDANFSLAFQPSRVEVSKGGDYAYTQGSYTLTVTDPKSTKPIQDSGSYVTVYKKQADGSWTAVSDIASSGPPAAPAK
jgi:ketosteroid isomerase-like protein